MNKEKFLKELEKQLSLLSEDERRDTIDEYRDIIEEKMKHGKTEKEAVKEFGSIDELSKEILSAYKLNPDYNKENSKKDFIDNAEEMIKKGAKKISEVTDDVVDTFKQSNFELTSQNIIEIILKIILLLLFLMVLKVPFYLISTIGESVFEIGFSPMPDVFGIIWKFIVEVIYIAICIFLIVKLILKYTKKGPQKIKEEKKKTTKEEKKETIKKQTDYKKTSSLDRTVVLLLEIFIIFVFMIPLWFIILFIIFGIIILIYLLIKGITVYGFLTFALGILVFAIAIFIMLYRGIFTKQKIYIYPFIISLVLMIIGGIASLDYIFHFKYYDYLPNDVYKQKTEVIKETINKQVVFSDFETEIMIDNSLKDNQIKIEVSYYPEFVSIEKHENDDGYDGKYISFITSPKDGSFNFYNKMNKEFIKYLKQQKIYNYSSLEDVYVKVYVNEHTKDLVELDD